MATSSTEALTNTPKSPDQEIVELATKSTIADIQTALPKAKELCASQAGSLENLKKMVETLKSWEKVCQSVLRESAAKMQAVNLDEMDAVLIEARSVRTLLNEVILLRETTEKMPEPKTPMSVDGFIAAMKEKLPQSEPLMKVMAPLLAQFIQEQVDLALAKSREDLTASVDDLFVEPTRPTQSTVAQPPAPQSTETVAPPKPAETAEAMEKYDLAKLPTELAWIKNNRLAGPLNGLVDRLEAVRNKTKREVLGHNSISALWLNESGMQVISGEGGLKKVEEKILNEKKLNPKELVEVGAFVYFLSKFGPTSADFSTDNIRPFFAKMLTEDGVQKAGQRLLKTLNPEGGSDEKSWRFSAAAIKGWLDRHKEDFKYLFLKDGAQPETPDAAPATHDDSEASKANKSTTSPEVKGKPTLSREELLAALGITEEDVANTSGEFMLAKLASIDNFKRFKSFEELKQSPMLENLMAHLKINKGPDVEKLFQILAELKK